MDRRSFFATLTAIGVVTVLPKVKPKSKYNLAPIKKEGCAVYEPALENCTAEEFFSKDEMHL